MTRFLWCRHLLEIHLSCLLSTHTSNCKVFHCQGSCHHSVMQTEPPSQRTWLPQPANQRRGLCFRHQECGASARTSSQYSPDSSTVHTPDLGSVPPLHICGQLHDVIGDNTLVTLLSIYGNKHSLRPTQLKTDHHLLKQV